jgi:hypothetical protein
MLDKKKIIENCIALYNKQQESNDDDDDWNPCKAAGVCLMLLANCCEDDIIPQ